MGALAPLSSWTSEDDQKLKNAMAEAGASLESLAKGAVQFSQKFTLQELEDHWHSLPNDPAVSLEAFDHIKECEHSPSTLFPRSHILEFRGEKSEPGKRKNESMGHCYHDTLKRVRKNVGQNGNEPPSADHMIGEDEIVGAAVATPVDVTSNTFHTEPCNCTDADLLSDQNSVQMNIPHNFVEDHTLIRSDSVAKEVAQPKDTSVCRLDDAGDLEAKPLAILDRRSISDANDTFNNFGRSSPLPQIPIWNSTDGISSELPHDGGANIAKRVGYDVHSDAIDQIPCDGVKDLAPITNSYLAVLSDYLMDVTDEEELLMEFDGKDAIGAFDLSSFLMNFPEEDSISNIAVSETIIPPDEHLHISGGVCAEDFGGDGHNSCNSESQMIPSIPTVNPEFPELRDGVICCSLNSEDPEIPCNDDAIFPSPTPSTTYRSGNQPTSSAIHDDRGPSRMNREESEGKPYSPPQMIESQILSELGINLPFINYGVKSA